MHRKFHWKSHLALFDNISMRWVCSFQSWHGHVRRTFHRVNSLRSFTIICTLQSRRIAFHMYEYMVQNEISLSNLRIVLDFPFLGFPCGHLLMCRLPFESPNEKARNVKAGSDDDQSDKSSHFQQSGQLER